MATRPRGRCGGPGRNDGNGVWLGKTRAGPYPSSSAADSYQCVLVEDVHGDLTDRIQVGIRSVGIALCSPQHHPQRLGQVLLLRSARRRGYSGKACLDVPCRTAQLCQAQTGIPQVGPVYHAVRARVPRRTRHLDVGELVGVDGVGLNHLDTSADECLGHMGWCTTSETALLILM